MVIEEAYAELIRQQQAVFDALTAYVQQEEPKGYLKLHPPPEKNNKVLEIEVGQFHFIFQAEIRPYRSEVLYKTFHRCPQIEDYPEVRYRNISLEELDLYAQVSGELKFKVPVQAMIAGFKRAKESVDTGIVQLSEFGRIYIERIHTWLIEQADKPAAKCA